MAIARLALFPGGTEKQYKAVVEALGPAHFEAQGRIVAAAGPVERGWQLVQVWESEQAIRQFVEEHLRAAFERAGDRGFQAPSEITDFPLRDLVLQGVSFPLTP